MLSQMKLNEYVAELGSLSPAPGGGSASALSGAQGAALGAMVAKLTIGKAKYAEFEGLCTEVSKKLDEQCARLVGAIDKDTEAFNLIADAFKLPKENDEEKAARREAIARGTLIATAVPFDTIKMAHEAISLCAQLVGKSNTNAASDLGVAALSLDSCAKGAWLNVLINLGGIKDEQLVAKYRTEGARLVEEIEKMAKEIYSQVINSL